MMNIHQSLQQILEAKDLLASMFYDHFLTQYPEHRPLFVRVDFSRQQVLLTTTLMIVERFNSSPSPAVEQYLQYLGTKHHQLDIPRSAYDQWTEAMLTTMQRFHGDDWSEDLAQQWRSAIENARDRMFQGYEDRMTV